jgi:hypothetical protein
MTLAELADEFGVSRERVRQIEARAYEKVQKAVKNRVAAIEMPYPEREDMRLPEMEGSMDNDGSSAHRQMGEGRDLDAGPEHVEMYRPVGRN